MRALRVAALLALAPAAGLAEGDDVTTAAPSAAADAYTVRPGDTLWDLSARFLSDPWSWPKVWSLNPEIANPHFIYPGNTVRFGPAAASGVAAPALAGGAAAGSEEDVQAPRELDDFSRANLQKPQEHGEWDDVAVVGPYRIGYVPPKSLHARRQSFVTERELAQAGVVSAAFEEKLLLSVHDRAYARFPEGAAPRPGDRFVLFHTERQVLHPATHAPVGYKSTLLGACRVVAVEDRTATVEITQAFEPIERGALLGAAGEKLVKSVRPRANARRTAGYIIASQQDDVTEIGEHHLVFVDKGRADGVEEGNLFTVLRSGDPYGKEMKVAALDAELPIEDVGALLVVDAQETSSAALVVRSSRELYVGDIVEMRTGAAAPAAPPAPPAAAPGVTRKAAWSPTPAAPIAPAAARAPAAAAIPDPGASSPRAALPRPVAPDAHRHAGFFIRPDVGLGYMALREPLGAPYGDLQASGMAAFLGVSVGGAVAENLIVSGTLYDGVMQNPKVSAGGLSASASGASVALLGFGPQVTYYLMPANVYLSAGLALTKVSLDVGGATGSTDLGFGARGTVGKEWWVSRAWGLGVAGQALWSQNKDTGAGAPNVRTWGAGLLFSATYN